MSDEEQLVTHSTSTAQKEAQRSVMQALRTAAGGTVNRDDLVTREGVRYVIPQNATLIEASKFLRKLAAEQDEDTTFMRTFNARPWDGAYCAYKVMREVFGAVNHVVGFEQGMFGPVKVKPTMISIPVGPGKNEQVPWGFFNLPGFEGCNIHFSGTRDEDRGVLFQIMVEGPKKYKQEIEGLFNVVEAACSEYSIYRGQAIDGGEQADFLAIDIDPSKVVYTGDVEVQLEANVWSIIEDTELQRAAGLPLKRSVLLHGPYGTGKSLFLGLTAQKAVANGWTFIRCRPGKDNYLDVLQTAALYSPAVVAFEDVDTLATADANSTDVARLLDTFDGVTAKGSEVVALLTTNHPERIHKGMVRPGRLDAVIRIADLDATGITKLVCSLIPERMLAPSINWGEVSQAMSGYMPAFIKEATDRAIRYALAKSKSMDSVTIDTEDLVNAGNGLRPQLEMMESAEDHQGYRPPLDRVFREMVSEATAATAQNQWERVSGDPEA